MTGQAWWDGFVENKLFCYEYCNDDIYYKVEILFGKF